MPKTTEQFLKDFFTCNLPTTSDTVNSHIHRTVTNAYHQNLFTLVAICDDIVVVYTVYHLTYMAQRNMIGSDTFI